MRRLLRRADEALGPRRTAATGKTGGQRSASVEDPAFARGLAAALVEDGVIGRGDVARVLERQREVAARGEARTFAELAVQMGLVKPEEVDRAVERRLRDDYRR